MIIEHGMLESYTGSSTIKNDDEIVSCTIKGPQDILLKEEESNELHIEIKVRSSLGLESSENSIESLISKLLTHYLYKKADNHRYIIFNIYYNTDNLSMIANSVLIACIDGGIPLKSMFYCVGSTSLYVFSNNQLELVHSDVGTDNNTLTSIYDEYALIKEKIDFSIRDMFKLD